LTGRKDGNSEYYYDDKKAQTLITTS